MLPQIKRRQFGKKSVTKFQNATLDFFLEYLSFFLDSDFLPLHRFDSVWFFNLMEDLAYSVLNGYSVFLAYFGIFCVWQSSCVPCFYYSLLYLNV